MPLAIELKSITKRFGAFVANDAVNLAVESGKIHAIIGENGAGKTTLMNILFGLLQPDEGEIWIDGKRVTLPSPASAIAAGIGMVHQHFKLVPSLTVADNVFLGMEILSNGLIDHAAQIEKTAALSKQFGLQVDPTERVGLLSVGIEQRIEILKVLVRGARIIILDEPTAVLTPQESRELFQTLRGFVAPGHDGHLHLASSRRGDGRVRHGDRAASRQGSRDASDGRLEEIRARADDGRPPREFRSSAAASRATARPVLQVRDLWARDDRRLPALAGVSFDVRAGEIVGIAGVAGNGQTELAEVIAGLRPASHGSITLDGRPVVGRSAREIRAVRPCPCARRPHGARRRPARIHCLQHPDGTAGPGAVVASRHHFAELICRQQTEALIKRFDIRAQGPDSAVKSLSGGNIQKVVLAREFSGDAALPADRSADPRRRHRRHRGDPFRDHASARRRARDPADLRAARRTHRAG